MTQPSVDVNRIIKSEQHPVLIVAHKGHHARMNPDAVNHETEALKQALLVLEELHVQSKIRSINSFLAVHGLTDREPPLEGARAARGRRGPAV